MSPKWLTSLPLPAWQEQSLMAVPGCKGWGGGGKLESHILPVSIFLGKKASVGFGG